MSGGICMRIRLLAGEPTVGVDRLSAGYSPATVVRGIATFDAVPTALDVAALKQYGLTVQPMEHLPLALVKGTVASMQSAVQLGTANDVYPDDPIELFDTASSDAMGAAIPRANGFTGKGTTVAVVDSGCDASHADLVCFSIGEVLFTTAVVTAYDHLLDQPDLWGVKVINNSWGNSFQQFDPPAPVAVATKAVADLGVSVIFAAGNSG